MSNKRKSPADKVVRTTVSVPAELKEQMDACERPINWSQVATRAFMNEINRSTNYERSLEAVKRMTTGIGHGGFGVDPNIQNLAVVLLDHINTTRI
jgi:hypothetical protein